MRTPRRSRRSIRPSTTSTSAPYQGVSSAARLLTGAHRIPRLRARAPSPPGSSAPVLTSRSTGQVWVNVASSLQDWASFSPPVGSTVASAWGNHLEKRERHRADHRFDVSAAFPSTLRRRGRGFRARGLHHPERSAPHGSVHALRHGGGMQAVVDSGIDSSKADPHAAALCGAAGGVRTIEDRVRVGPSREQQSAQDLAVLRAGFDHQHDLRASLHQGYGLKGPTSESSRRVPRRSADAIVVGMRTIQPATGDMIVAGGATMGGWSEGAVHAQRRSHGRLAFVGSSLRVDSAFA